MMLITVRVALGHAMISTPRTTVTIAWTRNALPAHLLGHLERDDERQDAGEHQVEADQPDHHGDRGARPEEQGEADAEVDDAPEQQQTPVRALAVGGDGFDRLTEADHDEEDADEPRHHGPGAVGPEQQHDPGDEADGADGVGGDPRARAAGPWWIGRLRACPPPLVWFSASSPAAAGGGRTAARDGKSRHHRGRGCGRGEGPGDGRREAAAAPGAAGATIGRRSITSV